jgi:ABC-type lipoprotein release transport system permease subunit
MVEATLNTAIGTKPRRHGARNAVAIAWRNLWRNRRRTWLMAGGIGFAVWLLVFAQSMQVGTFNIMVDNGARMTLGHVQVQHPDYHENPSLEDLVSGAPALRDRIETMDGVVAASLRAQSFALVSAEERSFGAQVMGVEAARESKWSTLPTMVADGRYLTSPGEAYVGVVLARNLGLSVGDELVMLGTAKEGGVAAAVANVVGIFDTGIVEIDRSLVQIPLADFQTAWSLQPDEAHALIVVAEGVDGSLELAEEVAETAVGFNTLNWHVLMPDAVQFIELKAIGVQLLFVIITIIVTFSVINSFMMTLFERTPEFGMLKAIGMRPGAILVQLQLEAIWLWMLGIAVGIGTAFLLIGALTFSGIPLPADAAELMQGFHLPDRLYPGYSWDATWVGVITMFVATQVAVLVPALRLRRLRCVEALRARE